MLDLLTQPIATLGAALVAALAAVVAAVQSRNALKQTTDLVEANKTHAARIQQRHDQVLSAISFFDGGSQRRNVGISSLEVLWADPELTRSEESWLDLYCGAVVYVLSEGKNKHKAHEILNVTRMMERLTNSDFFQTHPDRREDVQSAMDSFRKEAGQHLVPGDPRLVLLNRLDGWKTKMTSES